MRPRVVLITGTSSRRGIGYATARRLANGGHTVYATMRSLDTAADLAADTGPGRIEVRHLDLLDRSAMRPLPRHRRRGGPPSTPLSATPDTA